MENVKVLYQRKRLRQPSLKITLFPLYQAQRQEHVGSENVRVLKGVTDGDK